MAHKIREVYIVHHSHTDVGYTDLQEQVIYNQANNIRRAVELIEEGLEKGTNQKDLKWNCETWYCVEQFLKAATKEEKKTFFDLVKKNSIGLSANYLNFNAVCKHSVSLSHGNTVDIRKHRSLYGNAFLSAYLLHIMDFLGQIFAVSQVIEV